MIDQYIAKLEFAKNEFIRTAPEDALIAALDLIALVKQRVLTSGKDSSGGFFPSYTPSYKKTRDKAGRPTNHFYFSFTGIAWANLIPQLIEINEGLVVVRIEPRDKANKDKFRSQLKKRGLVYKPSEEEIKIVTIAHNNRRNMRLRNLLVA